MSITLSISNNSDSICSPLLSLRPPAGRAPYSAAIADHKPISGIPSGPRQGELDRAQADRAGRADVARTVLGQEARAIDKSPAGGSQILQAETAGGDQQPGVRTADRRIGHRELGGLCEIGRAH